MEAILVVHSGIATKWQLLERGIAQAASFPCKYTNDQPCLPTKIPSNRRYLARIFQIWSRSLVVKELLNSIASDDQQNDFEPRLAR